MNPQINRWTLLLSISIPCMLHAQEMEHDDHETEFAEPIFFDTSTDIGGDAKELEINYVPSITSENEVYAFRSGFEFEYVVVKNFGIEFEPGFTSIFDSSGVRTGLNDFEIETQYTFKATRTFGLAGGLEFGLPVGDRDMELSERTLEVEPFVTLVYKTGIGLSIQPRVSLGIGVFELDESVEAEAEGLEYIGNVALLYSIDNWFFGMEISGIYEDDFLTVLTPQLGVTIGHLFLGAGLHYFNTNGSGTFGGLARIIYEFEFGDE